MRHDTNPPLRRRNKLAEEVQVSTHQGSGGPTQGQPRENHDPRKDERRRIARQLNDSTRKLLARLNGQLDSLRKSIPPHTELLVEECQLTIEEIKREIRALNLD